MISIDHCASPIAFGFSGRHRIITKTCNYTQTKEKTSYIWPTSGSVFVPWCFFHPDNGFWSPRTCRGSCAAFEPSIVLLQFGSNSGILLSVRFRCGDGIRDAYLHSPHTSDIFPIMCNLQTWN